MNERFRYNIYFRIFEFQEQYVQFRLMEHVHRNSEERGREFDAIKLSRYIIS